MTSERQPFTILIADDEDDRRSLEEAWEQSWVGNGLRFGLTTAESRKQTDVRERRNAA